MGLQSALYQDGPSPRLDVGGGESVRPPQGDTQVDAVDVDA